LNFLKFSFNKLKYFK